MARTRFTSKERQEVIRLYVDENQSCAEIAERYGKCDGCITYTLRRAGIRLRHRQDSRNRCKGNEAQIAALYKEGYTVRQISKRFKSTIDTVSDTLKQQEIIPLTAPQRRRAELAIYESEIILEYQGGKTLKVLAKKYNVSYLLLKEMLKTHGLRVRTPVEYDSSITSRAQKVIRINISAIVKAYTETKCSVEQISKRFHLDSKLVSRTLREAGVKIDQYRRSRLTEEQETEAVRRYVSGSRIKDIQKAIGHPYAAVRAALVKHGIVIRTHLQINTRRFGFIGNYRHFLFRSLMELSFILDHESDHYVESAETHPITYHDGKKKRTYYPDFLLNHTCLVEVKPPSYLNDVAVVAKACAARIFCSRKGWNYVITDWPVDKARIGRLVQAGAVRITNRTPEEVAIYLGFSDDVQNT